eukprot:3768285-Rhodomonas_salina.5
MTSSHQSHSLRLTLSSDFVLRTFQAWAGIVARRPDAALWIILFASAVAPPPQAEGAGFRVQGAGCRVQASGCGVQGPGSRVQGPGSRVQGPGFRVQGAGFRVRGSGFRALNESAPTDTCSCCLAHTLQWHVVAVEMQLSQQQKTLMPQRLSPLHVNSNRTNPSLDSPVLIAPSSLWMLLS